MATANPAGISMGFSVLGCREAVRRRRILIGEDPDRNGFVGVIVVEEDRDRRSKLARRSTRCVPWSGVPVGLGGGGASSHGGANVNAGLRDWSCEVEETVQVRRWCRCTNGRDGIRLGSVRLLLGCVPR